MCAASGVPIRFQVAFAQTLPAAFLKVMTTEPRPFGSPGPGTSFAPVRVATAIGATLPVACVDLDDALAAAVPCRLPASAGPTTTAAARNAQAAITSHRTPTRAPRCVS